LPSGQSIQEGLKSLHNFPTSHLLLLLSKKGSVGGEQQRTLYAMYKAITLQKTQGPQQNRKITETCLDQKNVIIEDTQMATDY
jgi:hypothetical protein